MLVLEGNGVVRDFPGNYSQYREWVKLGNDSAEFRPPGDGYKAPEEKPVAEKIAPAPPSEKKKLSYKERREYELLEKEIADLEKEKQLMTEKMNSGAIPFDELQKLSNRSGEISQLLDDKELRWLELSEVEK
jgi:ATP-binding cassette subfamily F protein uup